MRFILKLRWASFVISAATLALIAIAALLVFQSSKSQSVTVDESNHYFCGLEYLQNGSYKLWPENPLLSRIVPAAVPYLNGYRVKSFQPDQKSPRLIDYFLFTYSHDYFGKGDVRDQLVSVRVMTLFLFILSTLFVWRWAVATAGNLCGILSIGLYAFTPLILAHSGLATTDITLVTFLVLLSWTYFSWIEKPNTARTVWLGFTGGFALLSKFSAIPFFFIVFLVTICFFLLRKREEGNFNFSAWLKEFLSKGLVAISIAMFLVWALHGFSFGAIGEEPVIAAGIRENEFSSTWIKIWVPAPEWFAGLLLVIRHNEGGQMAYALGLVSTKGFWFFYPLAVVFKSTIPFLILMSSSIVAVCFRKVRARIDWRVMSLIVVPVALIALGMFSSVNLGLRHLAFIYPLAIIGGVALLCKLQPFGERRTLLAGSTFVVLQVGIAFFSFPHYLSYFNAFAGPEPGKYLVDSDLDWGQGVAELEEFCQRNKVDTLHLAYFGGFEECAYDLPHIKILQPNEPSAGWVAVSEQIYWGVFNGIRAENNNGRCPMITFRYWDQDAAHRNYRWLDDYDLIEKIGGSIRVYFVASVDGKRMKEQDSCFSK